MGGFFEGEVVLKNWIHGGVVDDARGGLAGSGLGGV
jgi:hypothetical protein